MNCKLHERLGHAFIAGLCTGLILAIAVIAFVDIANAEETDSDEFPFGRVMNIEVVGPKDFAQNVISFLTSYQSPLNRPAAIKWRRADRAMERYEGWPAIMKRALWGKFLTDQARKRKRQYETLWIAASTSTAIPSVFYANGATLICHQKDDCANALSEYFAGR